MDTGPVPIGSDAQNFFTRLRDTRERLHGQSLSHVIMDEVDDTAEIEALTNTILSNANAEPLMNLSAGTTGRLFGDVDGNLLQRMQEDMMRSIGVPQRLLNEPLPFVEAPQIIRSPINPGEVYTITSNARYWDVLSSTPLSITPPFMIGDVTTTTQEKHVTISEEKQKELEALVLAAGVPAGRLDKFREAVNNFFMGYSVGADKKANDSSYRLVDKLRSCAQHWYIVFSYSTPERIIGDLFNHEFTNILLDTAIAIKNGAKPFTTPVVPVISMDIVQRFVSELAGLIKAGKVEFGNVDQNFGNSVPSRLSIEFRTDNVTLKDGPIGPVNFGKFDIVTNVHDFGYACGDSDTGPDSIYRIQAVDPVYPCDDEDCHAHPHLEYEHLCFGDGLGVAGNLVRTGLVAEAFQYIERILMTYGSSPYIGLEAWTDSNFCALCDSPMSEENTYYDGHTGKAMCYDCSSQCQLSDESIDGRYIKHCAECDKDFDSRRFLGSDGPPVMCVDCHEKEENEQAIRDDRFTENGLNTRPQEPAFPVIRPGERNCPSCGAQLGVSTVINGVTIVENIINGFDPLTRTQTCVQCDPNCFGISARSCEPNMRESYIWSLLYQFVGPAYCPALSIRNEDSFDTEILKSEWRAIDWYKVLANFRDQIGEHGTFVSGLNIEQVVEVLNRMFGYNVISEAHLSRV